MPRGVAEVPRGVAEVPRKWYPILETSLYLLNSCLLTIVVKKSKIFVIFRIFGIANVKGFEKIENLDNFEENFFGFLVEKSEIRPRNCLLWVFFSRKNFL